MGTSYIKKYIYFQNKFLYFQSCNYKIFMKIDHVLKVLLYVQNIEKKHVDKLFFVSKVFFLYQMFTKSFQFFVNF